MLSAVLEKVAVDTAVANAVATLDDIGPAFERPVDLLRDRRGIYGVGVAEEYAAVADDIKLVLRPDVLHSTPPDRYGSFAVLQQIPGENLRCFRGSREQWLREIVLRESLIRAGLASPYERCSPDEQWSWWSKDKEKQDRNRRKYQVLRRMSLCVVNRLIRMALAAAADPEALRVARRFRLRDREVIYRAGSTSRRFLQLAEVFPALAIDICHSPDDERIQEALRLVERGAPLRDVAAVMQLPMTLRHIQPGAAHLARLCHGAHISYMPNSLLCQRTRLRVVGHAYDAVPIFAGWIARHALQILAENDRELFSFVDDVTDWVRAGRNGDRLVVRPFEPTMSLRTVTRLSAKWHDAVASNGGPDYEFPAPRFPSATVSGMEIVPIDNCSDLYREGAHMRHCVASYAQEVRDGRYYVYSIRRDGKRIATAGLTLRDAQVDRKGASRRVFVDSCHSRRDQLGARPPQRRPTVSRRRRAGSACPPQLEFDGRPPLGRGATTDRRHRLARYSD
jgi:PcfJ-like protein